MSKSGESTSEAETARKAEEVFEDDTSIRAAKFIAELEDHNFKPEQINYVLNALDRSMSQITSLDAPNKPTISGTNAELNHDTVHAVERWVSLFVGKGRQRVR